MAKIMVETDNGDMDEVDSSKNHNGKKKKISKNKENDRRKEIAAKKKILRL